MPQKIDLTGQRFDRLVVTRPAPNKVLKNGAVRTCWYCDCDCGTKDCVKETTYLRGNNKTTPKIKSCGCYTKEAHYLSHKKFNKYDLSGEYGIGYTSKGEEFYFDLEDYDKIKDFSWHISHGYVISQRTREDRLRMHRFLFDDLPDDILIDHINGKRYDNRKANLRRVTIQQNNMNTDKYKNNKSGHKGVYLDAERGVWCADIRYNKKTIHLGRYSDINDAIKARRLAEERYQKEWSFESSQNQAKELNLL